jgi:hypothetical protein
MGSFISLQAQNFLETDKSTTDCNYIHDGIDLKTKEFRKELAPARLFEYTPPPLRNQLKEEHLMRTTAQFVEIDGNLQFNLNIRIQSLLAQEEYGGIQGGFVLRLLLIDGDKIELSCHAPSEGQLSRDGTAYIYPISYPVDKKAERRLSRTEIDKIGIQWSTGYEIYTIYEVDFFIKQLACLNQATPRQN